MHGVLRCRRWALGTMCLRVIDERALKRTVLALNIEEVGHNCWVLEFYLLGIQVPLQTLQPSEI